MAKTFLAIITFIVAAVIGIGVAFYVVPPLLPFLDQQMQIIIAIVLTLASFSALYFMTKGSGS